MLITEPTIREVVHQLKDYVPEYIYRRCGTRYKPHYEPYEKPQEGQTLIPPRILILISNAGNNAQWKADTLNERERAYNKILRSQSNRIYPLWLVCKKCKTRVAIQRRAGRDVLCYLCKRS